MYPAHAAETSLMNANEAGPAADEALRSLHHRMELLLVGVTICFRPSHWLARAPASLPLVFMTAAVHDERARQRPAPSDSMRSPKLISIISIWLHTCTPSPAGHQAHQMLAVSTLTAPSRMGTHAT